MHGSCPGPSARRTVDKCETPSSVSLVTCFSTSHTGENLRSGSHITRSEEIVGHKRTAEVLRLAEPKLPSHIHARAAFRSI